MPLWAAIMSSVANLQLCHVGICGVLSENCNFLAAFVESQSRSLPVFHRRHKAHQSNATCMQPSPISLYGSLQFFLFVIVNCNMHIICAVSQPGNKNMKFIIYYMNSTHLTNMQIQRSLTITIGHWIKSASSLKNVNALELHVKVLSMVTRLMLFSYVPSPAVWNVFNLTTTLLSQHKVDPKTNSCHSVKKWRHSCPKF